jgi:hypothetical protein
MAQSAERKAHGVNPSIPKSLDSLIPEPSILIWNELPPYIEIF